jgi:hypothetical protein
MIRRLLLLSLALLAACGSKDAPPAAPPDPNANGSGAPSGKLALNWQDLADPGLDPAVFPGLQRLLSEAGLTASSNVLVLGPCSGFLEYPIGATIGTTGHLVAACTRPSNWTRLQGDLGVAPNIKVLQTFELGSFKTDLAFDVAIIFDLSTELPGEGPAASFLASHLKPGGKLLFVHERFLRFFSPDLAWSPARLLDTFRREGPEFPLFKKLDPDLRADLQRQLDDPRALLDQATAVRLFDEFNRLLPDPSLFLELNAHFNAKTGFSGEIMAFIPAEKVQLTRWLYWTLSRDLLSDKIDTAEEVLGVSVLNHVLLSSIFAINIPAGRNQKERPLNFDTGYLVNAFGALGLTWVKTVEDFADVKLEVFTTAP